MNGMFERERSGPPESAMPAHAGGAITATPKAEVVAEHPQPFEQAAAICDPWPPERWQQEWPDLQHA
jgi:hypothetical protein